MGDDAEGSISPLVDVVDVVSDGSGFTTLFGNGSVVSFGQYNLEPAPLIADVIAIRSFPATGGYAAILGNGSVVLWGGLVAAPTSEISDAVDVFATEDAIARVAAPPKSHP